MSTLEIQARTQLFILTREDGQVEREGKKPLGETITQQRRWLEGTISQPLDMLSWKLGKQHSFTWSRLKWTMRFWRDRVTFVRLMDGLGTYSEGTSTQTWKNVCPPGPHYLALLIYVSQPLPHMKIINSKYCSTMMDHHVESCFKLATSRYCPDSAQPADSDQCKS